jgi:hypothetical protein
MRVPDQFNGQRRSPWWKALLAVPFIGLLWVPIYNRIEPAIWGVPFFYWYQFLWVLLTSVIIIVVHAMTDDGKVGADVSDEGKRS